MSSKFFKTEIMKKEKLLLLTLAFVSNAFITNAQNAITPNGEPTTPFIKQKLKADNVCNVNHTKDVVFSSDETLITATMFEGDVIINPGANVKLTGTVRLALGTKIIIKPGGKLIINEAALTTSCDGLWKGIEIQGDSDDFAMTNSAIKNAESGITFKKSAR